MIVSDSHRFVFVHVPKNAGSSITALLGPYSNARPLTKKQKAWQRHYHSIGGMHNELEDVLDHRERLKGYFWFAFARDPYTRAVSIWRRGMLRYDKDRPQTFEAFFQNFDKTNSSSYMGRQCRYVTPDAVDFLGRYETLERDWETICDRIGIEHEPLPHLTAGQGPTHEYTESSARIVQAVFADDFRIFGYDRDALHPVLRGPVPQDR